MRCVVLALLLVAPLADAAVRSGGHWQSLQLPSTADKTPTTTTTPAPTTPSPRRIPPYLEAALFRKAPTTTTPTTTTTAPESVVSEAEVLVMPGRFPPVWRPSLLGEELVGALIRHTATDEFERSHGRYVDSFIHGQPLGFF